MNIRRESLVTRLFVRLIADPLLSSPASSTMLKSKAANRSAWVGRLLHKLIDPTILPPPGYLRKRADKVYGEAYLRCFEYIEKNNVRGDVLEFGTFLGYTARWWAGLLRNGMPERKLYCYDSFEGLPEITARQDVTCYEVTDKASWFKGAMGIAQSIEIPIAKSLKRILSAERVNLVKGYFSNTLPSALPEEKAAIVHIDCDLYSSTLDVLNALNARGSLQDGTLIIMDDWNCNRANPLMGERSALTYFLDQEKQFSVSPWFSFGWHAQVFILHSNQ